MAKADYRAHLRSRFSRSELYLLLKEVRSFLPDLNRTVFAEVDLKRLAGTAKSLGAVLRVNSFEGEDGRALRGFYLNDATVLKRPLIVLNGVNDSISVAASFWHEMGHHLTHAIFGRSQSLPNLPFNSNYVDHLRTPDEFAADLVMVLAGYPKPAAERLFGTRTSQSKPPDHDTLLANARRHLRKVAKDHFRDVPGSPEGLQRMVGMIHLAKLREALLHEYGI